MIQIIESNLSPSEIQALSAVVQSGFTVILVVITGYYAIQTRKNVELYNQQIDQSQREEHTNELKERVSVWQSFLRKEIPPSFLPPHSYPVIQLVPESTNNRKWENDPYFHDFLENHAQEIKERKKKLESLILEFELARWGFEQEYDPKERLEDSFEGTRVKPTSNLQRWLFDRVLYAERGWRDLDQTIENISNELVQVPIEERVGAVVENSGYSGEPRLLVHDDPEGDSEWLDKTEQFLTGEIEAIKGSEEYEFARLGAKTLDEIEEDLSKLEYRLLKYEGIPRYEGDCEFLS